MYQGNLFTAKTNQTQSANLLRRPLILGGIHEVDNAEDSENEVVELKNPPEKIPKRRITYHPVTPVNKASAQQLIFPPRKKRKLDDLTSMDDQMEIMDKV